MEQAGGSVQRPLRIINGFEARVPESRVQSLVGSPHISSVTPDARVAMQHAVDGFDPTVDTGSLLNTATTVRARQMWRDGFRGQGVDVALIDSGVSPVEGLDGKNKLVHGPDLSFESQADNLRYLDTFGHGTHMAGIIAGRDAGTTDEADESAHHRFLGIAPRSRVVSVKVANAQGATDVSQVIAAIDWVVQHRTDNGLNIRVLNLSFGTDGVQDYQLDPLSYAVEVAWHKGIVVVVAGGNAGYGSAKLNNPAYNPYVIAVGASDSKGTSDVADDIVPEWSSSGNGSRNPDLVAPGKSVASLAVPSSQLDQSYPSAKVGGRFFRGSGTSQSAAVVSGAAALLLSQRPTMTPDQVKALLTSTAGKLPAATDAGTGQRPDQPSKRQDRAHARKRSDVAAIDRNRHARGGPRHGAPGTRRRRPGGRARHLRQSLGRSDLEWSDLVGSNLERWPVERPDLEWPDMVWADLVRSDMEWADLEWPNLEWTDVVRADLVRTDVERTDVERTDVVRANVEWADLERPDMVRPDLELSNRS